MKQPTTPKEYIEALQRENAALRAENVALKAGEHLLFSQRLVAKLEAENAALREQVEHLIGMIEQLESDLARFATVEAFEGKKEAQP